MKCAYRDLGEQPGGTTVRIGLQGSAANVLLLDPRNFARYRAGQSFNYYGGLSTRTPVSLQIPHDGHWHLVVDLGGHRGRVRAHVLGIEPPKAAGHGQAGRRAGTQRSASRAAGKRGELALH